MYWRWNDFSDPVVLDEVRQNGWPGDELEPLEQDDLDLERDPGEPEVFDGDW